MEDDELLSSLRRVAQVMNEGMVEILDTFYGYVQGVVAQEVQEFFKLQKFLDSVTISYEDSKKALVLGGDVFAHDVDFFRITENEIRAVHLYGEYPNLADAGQLKGAVLLQAELYTHIQAHNFGNRGELFRTLDKIATIKAVTGAVR